MAKKQKDIIMVNTLDRIAAYPKTRRAMNEDYFTMMGNVRLKLTIVFP